MLRHAYFIEAITWAFALAAMVYSAKEMHESRLDRRAEEVLRTSRTALVRTWENLKVEGWQMAQCLFLLALAFRTNLTPPPDTWAEFFDLAQFENSGRWIFLAYVMLKTGGRRAERLARRRTKAIYYEEFGPAGTKRQSTSEPLNATEQVTQDAKDREYGTGV
jgi:hypothetical protein